jgi:Leucine-rich repeat (LRR) protein
MNVLSGSIPSSIDKLTNLRYLALWYNKFSGSIPTNILTLTALESLDLAINKLTGTIPSSLVMLNTMKRLDISGKCHSCSYCIHKRGEAAQQIFDL